MRNKHLSRFGSFTDPGGALYHIFDEEGLGQMVLDMELGYLELKGVVIVPEVVDLVTTSIHREQSAYHDEVAALGVPDSLKLLFQIDKKSQVKKHCRTLQISEYDLFVLIHNCCQIDFKHLSKFPEYVPDHLEITEDDRENMKTGKPKTFTKKVHSTMLERRHISVHFFERGLEWHCFYFSYDDIKSNEGNHWEYGSHLHYVSHLWPEYSKDQVLTQFDKRSTDISGNFHIRFEPFHYPHPDEVIRESKKRGRQRPVIFKFSSVADHSAPFPPACLLTRGFITTKISI